MGKCFESIKKKDKKNMWVYIVFFIMVILQLGSIIYYFQFKKEGYHSDEMWSYGYANSYYIKDIYQNNDGTPSNLNEWVDGTVLKDYIVVNKGEEFAYDSIYHNQIYDLSPPLHSMILHTICSFFPEQFSRWFSFSINIVAFLVTIIFLFKTATLLKNEYFALATCLLYGFSLGARDTFIYLRMYALCTAFIMIILYHLVSYMKDIRKNKKVFNSHLVWIFAVSFLGFLTHYHMISFIGILTFLVCFYFLCKKKWKAMFLYGFSMLGSLLASLIVFPSILQVSNNQSTKIAGQAKQMLNYNFEIRFKIILGFITKKLFNITVSIYSYIDFPLIFVSMIVFLFFAIPILFLIRDTEKGKKILKTIIFFVTHFKQVFKYYWRRIRWIYIILAIAAIGQMIVIGETSNVYGMGECLDRYLMFMFPIVVLVGSAFLLLIIRKIIRIRRYHIYIYSIVILVMVGMNVYNAIHYQAYYFPRETEGLAIEEVVKDNDCIYVNCSNWILTAMVPYLYETDHIFRVEKDDYLKYDEEYRKRLKEEPLVLLVDVSYLDSSLEAMSSSDWIEVKRGEDDPFYKHQEKYNEMIEYFEDLEPSSKMKKVSTEKYFGRKMETYIINP